MEYDKQGPQFPRISPEFKQAVDEGRLHAYGVMAVMRPNEDLVRRGLASDTYTLIKREVVEVLEVAVAGKREASARIYGGSLGATSAEIFWVIYTADPLELEDQKRIVQATLEGAELGISQLDSAYGHPTHLMTGLCRL